MSENTTTIEEQTTTQEAAAEPTPSAAKSVETAESPAAPEPAPVEKKPLFRFRAKNDPAFSRDEWILSNINSDDLMDYLKLEHKRMELLQNAKDTRSKRLLTAFELTVSLATITAITYFLKDNPTILISILYTIGIISVFWLWKKPHDKNDEH